MSIENESKLKALGVLDFINSFADAQALGFIPKDEKFDISELNETGLEFIKVRYGIDKKVLNENLN